MIDNIKRFNVNNNGRIISLSEMIKQNPFDEFTANKVPNTMADFESWLNLRFEEMMKRKTNMILNSQQDDEMFDWVQNNADILGEVRERFKACKGN